MGAAVIELPDASPFSGDEADYQALDSLISITLERCLLLERLSEAELIERSENFKTALLSSVSHDMRTPLSAISASASSLTRYGSALPEATRADLLNMIGEQCERLNRYTTNLLNLGRLQAGLDHNQFVEADVLEVLGSAIARARGLETGHNISKHFEIAAALVRADPVMLEQVFVNVLENAIRYSPPDSPVEILAREEGDEVVVAITDSGEGIAPADVPHVFDRFYRGSLAHSHEGSGLGLSIAKGFVQAFGGSIEAGASGTGRGTSIRISLPLLSAEVEPA
jgi:two-component system sensor histidine kinase KdpD